MSSDAYLRWVMEQVFSAKKEKWGDTTGQKTCSEQKDSFKLWGDRKAFFRWGDKKEKKSDSDLTDFPFFHYFLRKSKMCWLKFVRILFCRILMINFSSKLYIDTILLVILISYLTKTQHKKSKEIWWNNIRTNSSWYIFYIVRLCLQAEFSRSKISTFCLSAVSWGALIGSREHCYRDVPW